MKRSRKSVRTKATAIPELRFEDHRLTSFAGNSPFYAHGVLHAIPAGADAISKSGWPSVASWRKRRC